MESRLFHIKNEKLILELRLEELPVKTCDMGDRHMLRTFHLAGTGVGAGTETELVHLGNHRLGPLGSLDLALRKKCEGAYTCGNEKHSRTVLACSYTGTAADTCSTVHALFSNLMGDRNHISVRDSAGIHRDEAAGLHDLVECLAVYDEVLDNREYIASPRLDSDGVTVLELAHVQLAGGHLVIRSMCPSVDIERTCTAYTLTAVMVERDRAAALAPPLDSYRIHTFMDELLVKDVEHLEKGAVRRYILDLVGLKMSFCLGVFLAPYLQS